MTLIGKIVGKKRVRYGQQECHGKTEVWKNRFLIQIAHSTYRRFYLFINTVLHELLHLWLFIAMEVRHVELSETRQHVIIYRVVAVALKEFRQAEKELRRGRTN